MLLHTSITEGDDLGYLIKNRLVISLADVDDILTLAHYGSRSGPQRLLRSLYERTVTLKYLAANPSEVKRFVGYDAIDWDQITKGIEKQTGLQPNESTRLTLGEEATKARKEYKGEVCPACKQRRQTNWTPKSVLEMATLTALDYCHLDAFVISSKLIHPTYWGLHNSLFGSAPLYNTLNRVHSLFVESVLIHSRHFVEKPQPTPMMRSVIEDFLKVWVFAETSFEGVLTDIGN